MDTPALVALVNKSLMDELTASVVYKILAEKVIDAATLSEELRSHSSEEMGHFNTLIDLATARGFCEQLTIQLDSSVLQNLPSEKFQVIAKVQQLEKSAINLYADAVISARASSDLEVERIFMGLLQSEQEHFDDLAQYTGEHRSK